jgi:hypothetical protein
MARPVRADSRAASSISIGATLFRPVGAARPDDSKRRQATSTESAHCYWLARSSLAFIFEA